MAYATAAELGRLIHLPSPTTDEAAAMDRVLAAAAEEIDWDLSYDPVDNPAPAADPILADVNLDRAVELWRANYSAFGVFPQGPEIAPVIAPRDTWYRHHLRLNPLRSSFPIA